MSTNDLNTIFIKVKDSRGMRARDFSARLRGEHIDTGGEKQDGAKPDAAPEPVAEVTEENLPVETEAAAEDTASGVTKFDAAEPETAAPEKAAPEPESVEAADAASDAPQPDTEAPVPAAPADTGPFAFLRRTSTSAVETTDPDDAADESADFEETISEARAPDFSALDKRAEGIPEPPRDEAGSEDDAIPGPPPFLEKWGANLDRRGEDGSAAADAGSPLPSAEPAPAAAPQPSAPAPAHAHEPRDDAVVAVRKAFEPSDSRRRLHLRDISESTRSAAESVGAELRDARVTAGLDLRDVSDALRIRFRHLDSLERGDLSQLPGKTYAVGFVRAYAEYLGLNPDDLVRRFKAELGEPVAAAPAAKSVSELGFPNASEEARLPTGITMLLLGLLITAGIAGWYFLRSPVPDVADVVPPPPAFTDTDSRLLRPPPSVPSVGTRDPSPTGFVLNPPAGIDAPGEDGAAVGGLSGVPDAGGDTAAADTEATTDLDTSGPVLPGIALAAEENAPPESGGLGQVEILALRRAWLRIEDSAGNVVVQEEVGADEMIRVPEQVGLILIARDAGAFELIVDGRRVGRAGRNGEVLRGISLNAYELKRRDFNRQDLPR